MVAGDARGNVSNKRLGRFLKRVENRYENGLKFVKAGDDRTKTARWCVVSQKNDDKTLHKKDNNSSMLNENAGFCRGSPLPTQGEAKLNRSKPNLITRNYLPELC